jgi:hypothetical protein
MSISMLHMFTDVHHAVNEVIDTSCSDWLCFDALLMDELCSSTKIITAEYFMQIAEVVN